ncbi:MAG TPA: type II toxin-antitoxin system VapC family toxin [Gemmatimonadales bacterium]
MIFVDSNIPMYLVGAEHLNKARAAHLLEQVIVAHERLVTDAEVLQEILHRYAAINRREAIRPALEATLGVVDEVFAIEQLDLERAAAIVTGQPELSARDAIHIATMQRHHVQRILSFDRAFDRVPGVVRLGE